METSRFHTSNTSALPIGTRLGEFVLRELLGAGGFGIVYLGFDEALEREVAIKEYMPVSLAGRTQTLHVSLRSQSDAETFELGLRSFINEAKMLAKFDHPSLLKVYRTWQANGTAYMAMPVLRGRTLKQLRTEMTQPPDEAWLRAVLEPLLSAIEVLHQHDVFHRDIAPDNIVIEPDGRPVLLDFGAARRVLSDKSQALTAILKPAYAPIEQYGEVASVKQGPWTDLYALGATLHYMLLNRPPAPATARAVIDDTSSLTTEGITGCSETFLRAIDWMLAPRPADRPQSVAQLRGVLHGHRAAPRRAAAAAPAPTSAFQDDHTVVLPPRQQRGSAWDSVAPAPAPEAAPSNAPAPQAQPLHAADSGFAAPPVAIDLELPRPAPARSRLMPAVAGLAAVAIAGVAAVLFWPGPRNTTAVAEPAASAVAAAPTPSQSASTAVTATAPAASDALPPAPTLPESQIASVVLPGATGIRPAAQAPAPAPQKPAQNTTATTTPAPSTRPAPSKPTATQAPVVATTAPAPATAGNGNTSGNNAPPANNTAAVRPQPEPVKPVPAAPVNTQPAPQAAEPPRVVQGPEARCASKANIGYFICMERECLRSEFASHADCLKWRQNAKHD